MKKLILLILLAVNLNTSAVGLNFRLNQISSDSLFIDSSRIHLDKDSLINAPDTTMSTIDSVKIKHSPVVYKPYNNVGLKSFYIMNSQIYHNDYRYTGDALLLLPFSFLQDLGSVGQPNELIIYGLSNGNISHSNNGINFNNRWQNSLDTYFMQSEYLDSVEQIPLTSGFLYNTYNNPVHLNYISKNGISKRPYSKMRFYQAPSDEGYADVVFNSPIYRDTYFYFELSNISADPRGGKQTSTVASDYNTDISLWSLNTGVRYLFNSASNLLATYKNANKNTELNGGVLNTPEMYNPLNAEVVYPYRYERITKHEFSLSLNTELFQGSATNITGYYQYNRQDFNQNKDSLSTNIPRIVHTNFYKTYGLSGRQIFKYGFFDFDLLGNYEHNDYTTQLFGNVSENIISAASKLRLNFYDSFFPSFYAKTSNYRKVQFNGFGTEGVLSISKYFKLFGGVSFIEKPFSLIEKEFLPISSNANKQKLHVMELRTEFSAPYINGSLGYFYYKNDKTPVGIIEGINDSTMVNEITYFNTTALQRSGINMNLDFRIWKFEITNNTSYYLEHNSNKYNSLPQFTLRGGIYYIDTLFQSNLYLKAGVNYKISGKKSFLTYDFEKALPAAYTFNNENNSVDIISNEIVPSSRQLDIFIAGTIQKKAIIYIVFENLLDENYYLIPYYPMYPQGLRFGVSWEFVD